MKLWSGRFRNELDSGADDFNSSVSVDARMYAQDIRGSIAHARMLGRQGIIEKSESEAIVAGLEGILADIESGALRIDAGAEDIHMFVEATLTERLGDAGKRLHTARSRNDQVALDTRLYLRDQAQQVRSLTASLITALCECAQKHTDTVMPAYTHLQRAQPVTFAHHILAWGWMLSRDLSRLDDWRARMNLCPLGAGAVAGTTYPIDRAFVAGQLGFAGVTQNSMDSVADRDFAVELAGVLAMEMMHLSRFCEEIILWSSAEFGFVRLSDAYSTGSSIMPQKKNPDIAELIRGKTGRVYGDLTGLLTMLKGLPLAYNKDMQEDKEAVFDAVDTAKSCLEIFTPMFASLTVNAPVLRAAAAGGFINATDCADYLVKRGVPFRDAYMATGRLVARCEELGVSLEGLPAQEFRAAHPAFDEGIYAAITPEACAFGRKSEGGPAPESVAAQIGQLMRLAGAQTGDE